MSRSYLRAYANDLTTSAGLGVSYGVIVWIIFAGILRPIWLGAVGFPRAPSVPNFNSMSLVGNVVYAVILGALLPVVRDR